VHLFVSTTKLPSRSFDYYQTTSVGRQRWCTNNTKTYISTWTKAWATEHSSPRKLFLCTLHHFPEEEGGAFVLHTMGADKCFSGVPSPQHKRMIKKQYPNRDCNWNNMWPVLKWFIFKFITFGAWEQQKLHTFIIHHLNIP